MLVFGFTSALKVTELERDGVSMFIGAFKSYQLT